MQRVQDLWLHLPLRYEDRTRLSAIRALQPGIPAQVEGRVEAVERGFRFRPMLQVAVGDDSGATLVLRFFHFTGAQVAQFVVGRRVRVYGTPRSGRNGLEIAHPSYNFLADEGEADLRDRLDPVYPAVEGIGAGALRRLICLALQRLPPSEDLELLPPQVLRAHKLPSLRDALLTVHQPTADTDLLQLAAGVHPAQKRLALEELLAYQLSLRRQRMAVRRLGARPILATNDLADALRKKLGFVPTAAQERVLRELHADIARDEPMLRLLQGDVGCGKTVVAALAALRAVAAGRQVALMAPTELLAEQHLATFRAWLEPLGIAVAWLAGKLATRARRETLAAIADGSAQVVVGTHALMQEGVTFADLGLAIVDEQHRFGVHQRLALRDKGRDGERVPHQLVMTATPIPRTLAMTAYADLDVSVIDELPPGRTPVQTVAASAERRAELIDRIRIACVEGRQAYWVCTLIETSEDIEAQSATALHAQLSQQLPGLRVRFVHGRMKPAEKQATMRAFKDGALDLLVATTVIEVGVDVPRASLMVIENAER
ncbi:MAG TPA: ATP-dependent DNA helicase RecG, partial [Xanthomonadaceae bacterium]|nr:ATP-dependent DNA helicase RecG [Xanthomonadaceae bacterium]